MSRLPKVLLALVVVAALGVGGFFVFEHFEKGAKVKDSKRGCGTLDTPKGSPTVPASLGITLPAFEQLNSVDTQGKTVIVDTSVAGGRDDLVRLRDTVLADLVGQGFTKAGTDQEPTYEAEASFKGRYTGSIKVKPLCTGRNEVRYTFRT